MLRNPLRRAPTVKTVVQPPLPKTSAGTVQPLPEGTRPSVSPSSLMDRYLGKIEYTRSDPVSLYVEPLWTPKVRKAFKKHSFRWFTFRYLHSANQLITVKGSFEDAVKVAAQRANSTATFKQAQAIFEGDPGEWLVGAVGSIEDNISGGKTHNHAAIDGSSGDSTFEEAFGEIRSIERQPPGFVALVGSTSYLDFRHTDSPRPLEVAVPALTVQTTEEPDKNDPWHVSGR
jgi:hypothetical protein